LFSLFARCDVFELADNSGCADNSGQGSNTDNVVIAAIRFCYQLDVDILFSRFDLQTSRGQELF
jgi:hypothetical protein